MNVALCQFDIAWENKTANFEKVRGMVEAAKLAPDTLLVLPEMFASGFSMNVPVIADGGEIEAFLGELARKHFCSILAGVVQRGADGRGRNDAVLIGPDGARHARYTKIHPFSFADEDKYFAPGNVVLTFPWSGLIFAPMICYDLRFPEVFRIAVRKNADVFCVIANWPQAREAHWLTLLKARAIENQAYVIGVNRCGKDPRHAYSGRSQVIGPRGEVLADAGNGETILTAKLDIELQQKYRAEFPALGDMRLPFLGNADEPASASGSSGGLRRV